MPSKNMTIMEIVANLGLIYTALVTSSSPEFKKDTIYANNLIALQRAMQILISVDLKNEMEAME